MEQRSYGAVALRTRQDLGQGLFLAVAVAVTVTVLVLAVFPDLRAIFARATHTQSFWDSFTQDPRLYLYPLMVVALIAYAWLRRTYERLIVGPEGLRYVSFLGGPFTALQALHPGWMLSWSEVRKVELQVQSLGLGKRAYWLVVDPEGAKKRIERPLAWEQVPEISHSRADRVSSRDEEAMRKAILASPLVRALRQFGVQVTERPGLVRPAGAIKGYDIAQDKGMTAAAVALIVLLLYFLGDTFFIWPYMALQDVPVWPYAVVGALGLWIGLGLGKKAPRMERTLISILLSGALCAAWYPVMLRMEALTAGTDDHVYGYTQLRQGYFKPPEAGLPYIYFDNEPAYWGSFRNGTTHDFRVLKGVLGFYEVDTGRVQDEVRAWWRTQKFR